LSLGNDLGLVGAGAVAGAGQIKQPGTAFDGLGGLAVASILFEMAGLAQVGIHFPLQSRFQKVLEQWGKQAVLSRQGLAFVEAFDGRLLEGFAPGRRYGRIGQS